MADKVEIIRTRKAELPNLKKLSREFWKEVRATVRGNIVANIEDQKQADGSPLKKNPTGRDPKTGRLLWGSVKLKQRRPLKSLMYRLGRFIRATSWKTKRVKGGIEVFPSTARNLENISEWVQEKGYTGWFGISKEGKAAIRESLRDEIKRQWAKAAKK